MPSPSNLFSALFDSRGFVPHGQCGGWTPALSTLHKTADLLVWSACVAIPFILVHFARKRRDLPFRPIFWLFGAFIILCGFTHFMNVYTFYSPIYRFEGALKLITGLVSWGTVMALIPAAPKALAMRFPEELEAEIAVRKQAQQELTELNRTLETRVAERTAEVEARAGELSQANDRLRAEIGDRKRLEAQLLHSQKLESVGTLAGGIAHDFNNVLTAIMGYAELARARVVSDPEVVEDLHNIQAASERAATLIRQLLAFARKQVIAPKRVNVNVLIEDLLPMLRRLIGEHVQLTTDLSDGLEPVQVDPSQFDQVVVNLVVNAKDAMPDGGKLRISTVMTDVNEVDPAGSLDLEPGRYTLVSITDSGIGMTDDVKAKVFEPFYTTKEFGKGSGLGLSTCYGIVKQSGGDIRIDTNASTGTRVRIYLPIASETHEVNTEGVEKTTNGV